MIISAYRHQFHRLSTCASSISAPNLYTSASEVKRAAHAKLDFIDSIRPFSGALVDSYNRRHDYLRISLTEKCNLRCFYCMPEEGIQLSPSEKILTDEEILRLAKLFVQSGVTKIRLTGGEPTIRKGIANIISGLNDLRPDGLKSIAMTSNGLALHRQLPNLVENGLTHLNLSLDTLDPFKFEFMAKRPGLDAVLKTLNIALQSPRLQKVKLNVVVVKGLNDSEVPDFVEMTRDQPVSVRFIEFMPFTGNKWNKFKMVPSSDLLKTISERHSGVVRISDDANDTARSWKIPGYRGEFGFISSMSDHFCSTCNRLRITSDGQIKVCLFDAKEISLRDEMRKGASDSEILRIIGQAVHGKEEKHLQMEDIDVVSNRPMILIGGPAIIYPTVLSTQNSYAFTRNLKVRMKQPRLIRNFYSSAIQHFSSLTHLDRQGRAAMVDVSEKLVTKRSATAIGRIYIPKRAYDLINTSYPSEPHSINASPTGEAETKVIRKGDTLTVAQLAAIMGSKKTSDLIPLCHPLPLTNVKVNLTCEAIEQPQGTWKYSVVCHASVDCEGKTGVEMEALTAVSVGLLTVWDMLKAVAGKEMIISEIMVSKKSGGRSGDFSRT
ncbi:molybdenum cofactor biosynthesis prote [Lentinula aciculospora]|uniref:Molybdenum cofactor biosynthesis prote n=1 Tax=Lentinula aciculospora TaxID=153920 RepID=A0A9W9ANC1_9AGAR|nr:molybdenum cofactor biosynthesis prote [Lentinula aciculospora]